MDFFYTKILSIRWSDHTPKRISFIPIVFRAQATIFAHINERKRTKFVLYGIDPISIFFQYMTRTLFCVRNKPTVLTYFLVS